MMKKAHFIGVCGVGMSATAKLLKDLGWEVSGSDDGFYPPGSELVGRYGIHFLQGYRAENIPTDVELIVIGKNAKLTPEGNEEVKAALKSGASVRSFPEVLEQFAGNKSPIVVAGSYGKSTCTALLAWCLLQAGKEPSYFLGAVPVSDMDTARLGAGKTFILEGDEYPASNWDPTSKFLYYHPHDVLLTAALHDHVNVFPTHEEYLVPFKALLSLIPEDGLLVASADDKSSLVLAQTHPGKTVLYGLNTNRKVFDISKTFWSAGNISFGETTTFILTKNNGRVARLKTKLLGTHNVQNIVGISALLLEKGLLTPQELASGVQTFPGLKRRLNALAPNSTVPVYEGFGSSYTKARTAIEAMLFHFPKRRLVVVFEPHQALWRSREMIHWYDDVFSDVDEVFIYKPPTQWITKSQLTLEEILERIRRSDKNVVGFETPDKGLLSIGETLQPNDVILILTSGGMDGMIEHIPKLATQKFPRT